MFLRPPCSDERAIERMCHASLVARSRIRDGVAKTFHYKAAHARQEKK